MGVAETPAAGTALHPADSCSLAGCLLGSRWALAPNLARGWAGWGDGSGVSGSAYYLHGPLAPSPPPRHSLGSVQFPPGRAPASPALTAGRRGAAASRGGGRALRSGWGRVRMRRRGREKEAGAEESGAGKTG